MYADAVDDFDGTCLRTQLGIIRDNAKNYHLRTVCNDMIVLFPTIRAQRHWTIHLSILVFERCTACIEIYTRAINYCITPICAIVRDNPKLYLQLFVFNDASLVFSFVCFFRAVVLLIARPLELLHTLPNVKDLLTMVVPNNIKICNRACT